MTKKSKKIVIKSLVIGILALCLVVLLITRSVSAAASDFITLNITKHWVWLTGHFTSLFPFSIFEITIILLIITCLILIILLIRSIVKRNFSKILSGLMIIVIVSLSVVNFYTLTAGFAYNRSAVPIPVSAQKYKNEEIIEIATYYLDDYNNLAQSFRRDSNGNVISPYGIKELSEKIALEFNKMSSPYFFDYSPRAKGMINSWFMTVTDISGITFLPFGEPVINKDMPTSEIPVTMAHEMAHSKGVMREGDCNLVAYYITVNSDDDYLRYCGYHAIFGSILSAVDAGKQSRENYLSLSEKISPLITAERKNSSKFWYGKDSRDDFVGKIYRLFSSVGDFFNDLYLKISGVDNGNNSYGDTTGDGFLEDTGEVDPDTDEPIYEVHYSTVQKMFFYIYENKI